jgi:hypothetical protein
LTHIHLNITIYHMSETWKAVKSNAAAGLALLALMGAAGAETMHYAHDQAAAFKRQVGQQVRRDGFTTESGSGSSIDTNNIIHIGELSLGFCELPDVTAKIKMAPNYTIANIVSYSFDLPGSDVPLRFDDAAQAERELAVPLNGAC